MPIAYRIHSAGRTPMSRLYARLLRRGKQRYVPIGYGCSRCDENYDAGLRRPEPGWLSDYAISRPLGGQVVAWLSGAPTQCALRCTYPY